MWGWPRVGAWCGGVGVVEGSCCFCDCVVERFLEGLCTAVRYPHPRRGLAVALSGEEKWEKSFSQTLYKFVCSLSEVRMSAAFPDFRAVKPNALSHKMIMTGFGQPLRLAHHIYVCVNISQMQLKASLSLHCITKHGRPFLTEPVVALEVTLSQ